MVTDLALLLDDRDLVTDILAGLVEHSTHLSYQRELMNTANEYMFMVINSFSVYTDLQDLIDICDEAVRVFEDMRSRVDSLEPAKIRNDPGAFLKDYANSSGCSPAGSPTSSWPLPT